MMNLLIMKTPSKIMFTKTCLEMKKGVKEIRSNKDELTVTKSRQRRKGMKLFLKRVKKNVRDNPQLACLQWSEDKDHYSITLRKLWIMSGKTGTQKQTVEALKEATTAD